MPHQNEGVEAQGVAEAEQVAQIGGSRVITVAGPIAVAAMAPAPTVPVQPVENSGARS